MDAGPDDPLELLSVLEFLKAHGFDSAEAALKEELRDRGPNWSRNEREERDEDSSSGSHRLSGSPPPGRSHEAGPMEDESGDQGRSSEPQGDTKKSKPTRLLEGVHLNVSEEELEAHDAESSGPGSGSGRKSYTSTPRNPVGPIIKAWDEGGDGSDEYDDEEDPGYVRHLVRNEALFLASEVVHESSEEDESDAEEEGGGGGSVHRGGGEYEEEDEDDEHGGGSEDKGSAPSLSGDLSTDYLSGDEDGSEGNGRSASQGSQRTDEGDDKPAGGEGGKGLGGASNGAAEGEEEVSAAVAAEDVLGDMIADLPAPEEGANEASARGRRGVSESGARFHHRARSDLTLDVEDMGATRPRKSESDTAAACDFGFSFPTTPPRGDGPDVPEPNPWKAWGVVGSHHGSREMIRSVHSSVCGEAHTEVPADGLSDDGTGWTARGGGSHGGGSTEGGVTPTSAGSLTPNGEGGPGSPASAGGGAGRGNRGAVHDVLMSRLMRQASNAGADADDEGGTEDDDDDEEEEGDEEGEVRGGGGRRRGMGRGGGESGEYGGDEHGDEGEGEGGEGEYDDRGHGGGEEEQIPEFDLEAEEARYETFELKVIHRRNRTGFEESKDFPIRINDIVAGRYQVLEYLGSAAFSRAVQALDMQTGLLVCMKIIKNNKDFFDQSLDEIKLLKYINTNDPGDEEGVLRLYDYFYHREHLFIVCELLRANLYEFQKYNREQGDEAYFTMPRLQSIARQCLRSLAFLHSLDLIHSDLKPENILVKSYSRCEVKIIDLGSSCFVSDHLSSYVQSRSYRAPEVILGMSYSQKIDIWSLGCILAELCSGNVLFQNDSLATLLVRVVGILGPMDPLLLRQGRFTHRFFTRSGQVYERNPESGRYEYLVPKKSSLRHRLPEADDGLLDLLGKLLEVDPSKRPTAEEALQHPWLHHVYEEYEE